MKHRFFSLLLIVAMVMSFGIHAYADEADSVVPEPIRADSISSSVGAVLPKSASFSISFSNLGANYYVSYSGTFSLSGSEKLGYSSSWSPVSQDIKIGVRNTSTGSFYATTISGGNDSGTLKLSTLSIPSGVYEVVVINPYGASYSVSGNINFTWK